MQCFIPACLVIFIATIKKAAAVQLFENGPFFIGASCVCYSQTVKLGISWLLSLRLVLGLQ